MLGIGLGATRPIAVIPKIELVFWLESLLSDVFHLWEESIYGWSGITIGRNGLVTKSHLE